MKNLAVMTLMAAFSASATAQQWSAEQQEVWKTVEALWDASDCQTWIKFFGEDYRGWVSPNPAPMTKDEITPGGCRWYDVNDYPLHKVHPLAIDVRDDVAVVFYSYQFLSVKKVDKSEHFERGNVTEVYQKRDGGWILIAGAGWPLP